MSEMEAEMDFPILRSNFPAISQPKEANVATYILNRNRESQSVGEIDGQIINASAKEGERGQCIKYSEFDRLSCNVARALRAPPLNFCPGDIFVYSAIHHTQSFPFLLGIWRADGIPLASYAQDIEGGGLLRRILQSKTKFLLVDQHHAAKAVELVESAVPWKVNVLAFGEALPSGCISAAELFFQDATASRPIHPPPCAARGDATAVILPTSGTTGESKGAMLSHKAFIHELELVSLIPYEAPILFSTAASAPTHVYGLRIGFARIAVGQDIIGVVDNDSATIASAVHRFKPRTILAFPKKLMQMVEMSCNKSEKEENGFDSVRVVELAGSVIPSSYIKQLRARLPNWRSVIIMYGMTEFPTIEATLQWTIEKDGHSAKYMCAPSSSSGFLCPGVELKVLKVDSSSPEGDNLGPHCVGEFWVRSPSMFSGYFNNPEATKATVVDGWLRTRDVGYYDEQGLVFNCGRIKDIIVSHGNHVCPQEIEEVLLQHSQVKEACVVGIQDLDDDLARAFVVLKEDRPASNGVAKDQVAMEIEQFVNDRLPEYKHIRAGVVILPNLMYGKSGKVDSNAIKAAYGI